MIPEGSLTHSSKKIKVKDYLVFVSDGQVIGRLDAEFNLEELPPHLHIFAVEYLSRHCSNFDLPLAPIAVPATPVTSAAPISSYKTNAGHLQKIKNYLLGLFD